MIRISPIPPLFITAVLLALLFSCSPSDSLKNEELEAQKRQWAAECRDAFPDRTQDTVELRRRFDHFRERGNLVGQHTILRSLGNEARNSSLFGEAIEHHTQALEIAYGIVDTVSITMLLNELGTDFRRTGAWEEAMKYHYRSLDMSENYRGRDTAAIMRNMASSYNGLGVVYSAMNEQAVAVESYENALHIEIGKQNYLGMAMNYANLGSVYLEQGDYDRAMEYFLLSLENNTKINSTLGIGLCNLHIGSVHEARGDRDGALARYLAAYDILAGTSDTWHWVKACFSIGKTCMSLGDYRRAKRYLDEGLRAAGDIRSPGYIEQAYALLSDYHYALGDYRASRDELQLSRAWGDTVRLHLATNRLLEPQVEYRTAQYAREIEDLDRENLRHEMRRKTEALIGIPVFVALILLSIFFHYRRRLKEREAAGVRELERMRSNFFTNITHEFRTPLTMILGYSGRLRDKFAGRADADPADAEQLEAIERNGGTLLHLVNQLLEFARSESGKSELRWRRGDLAAFLRSVAEPFDGAARDGRVTLSTVSETHELVADYAPEGLKTVLGNLLSNAIRHTPAGGRVEMLLRPEADERRFAVTVRDTGEGIASENLSRIFELYYTSAEGGMGIGLALTRQLVEEMGGTIAVASAPGRGTEFTVSLPVSAPAATRSGGKKPLSSPDETGLKGKKVVSSLDETCLQGKKLLSSTDETCLQSEKPLSSLNETCLQGKKLLSSTDETAKSTGKPLAPVDATGSGGFGPLSDAADGDRPVVLVVEDNADMARYIHTVLGDRYAVLHAADGVEGFEMAELHVPDLIVTDVMMPRKDGYALTADIRAAVATSHIPVIMLTARAADRDRIEGIRTGADAYLAKPFNEEELVVRIEKLLESRARLMEVYSGALLAGSAVGENGTAGAEVEQNLAFLSNLSTTVTEHIADQDYFPDGLAADICLSRSQLNRKLKAMTGHTVSSFVMLTRMNRAEQMLSAGVMNISEVAMACGFDNMSYFTRSFRETFGYTPSQYLKKSYISNPFK